MFIELELDEEEVEVGEDVDGVLVKSVVAVDVVGNFSESVCEK